MFTTWKRDYAYLQANFRKPDRKYPQAVCACLGRNPDAARERLTEILDGQVDNLPALVDRLVSNLETTWSPAAEAKRMSALVTKLWERAEHPEVKVELAVCCHALDKLAGKGAEAKSS